MDELRVQHLGARPKAEARSVLDELTAAYLAEVAATRGTEPSAAR